MAGIGFELRQVLRGNSLLSLVHAYGIAAVISCGPWVLSIVALLVIGYLSVASIVAGETVVQFLLIVTYIMAGSLILSGFFQLMLTRFISDRIFLHEEDRIVPNLLGAMIVTSVVASALIFFVLWSTSLSSMEKWLLHATFVLMCNQWLVVLFLSGIKKFYRVVATMGAGYGLMVLLVYALQPNRLVELLLVFALCQALMTFAFLFYVIRSFPATQLVQFQFANPRHAFYSLACCGVLYNFGVWVDKFIFWWRPETSHQVLDFFRASFIYDLPIFMSYLAIVPGMAIFLLKLETDFAESCRNFYDELRGGATLQRLGELKDDMRRACREGIYLIVKVQGATLVLVFLAAPSILDFFAIDRTYLRLFYADLIGVSLQVLVLAVLNVLFYLDKRREALKLAALMALLNGILSYVSVDLGELYFGYGFAISMLVTALLGLIVLDRQFEELEYRTFMLQRT